MQAGVLPQRAARRTALRHNHKPDAMHLFFESKPNQAVLSSLRTPQPRPADLDTWTLTR